MAKKVGKGKLPQFKPVKRVVLSRPSWAIPQIKDMGTGVEDYIKAFTRLNCLKPSAYLINGRMFIL